MVDSRQVSHYICSKCNTVLKEMPSSVDYGASNSFEQCPSCGYQLAETLQIKKQETQRTSFPELQTAYELAAKMTLDIDGIDRTMTLAAGDRLCIVGSRRNANLLLTRLWVRALMSQRHGGLAAKTVLCIDGGNCANVYQCVNFARQYGMEVRSVLRSIIISRTFTIYQLARLVVRKLQNVIQRFSPKVVVISDLLKMFVDDPQVQAREAQYLLGQIMKAIECLSDNILIVVSLYGPMSAYDKLVLPSFGKRIELTDTSQAISTKLFGGQKMLSELSLTSADLRIVAPK